MKSLIGKENRQKIDNILGHREKKAPEFIGEILHVKIGRPWFVATVSGK